MNRRTIVFPGGTLDLDTGVLRGRSSGRLPGSELRVVRALVAAGGRAVPRAELAAAAWPGGVGPGLVQRTLARLSERLGGALGERSDGSRLRFEWADARWQLRVLAPDGSMVAVPVDGVVSIGRAPDNDLVLAASQVSRYHATVRREAAGLEVEDRGSGNGVHVDGRRVARAAIGNDGQFEIRPYTLQVFRVGESDALPDAPTTRVLLDLAEHRQIALTLCTVDLAERRVRSVEGELPLTNAEAALLEYLVRAAPRVVPKEELLANVWGYHPNVHSRTVDTTLYRLRMKVERDAREPEHLLTVRGEGYVFLGSPDASGPTRRTNLSRSSSALYGREAELASVLSMLDEQRAVEVVGPAGVGKTRLLRSAAAGWAQRSPERGAWYVDLTGVTDQAELAARIGQVLGVEAVDGGAALRWVADHRGPLALILDPVDGCAAEVQRLLAAPVRGLWWLVGARAPLGTPATRSLTLGGLDPASARALFRDAGGDHPHPEYADDTALEPLLAQLDYNPLAIELAAQWASLLPPHELEARMQRLPERSPLWAAVAAAWDGLDPQRRQVLAQCAVFRGPFSLADAEEVVRTEGPLLADLQPLCRAALLEPVHGPEARFRVPSSVRSFASERGDPEGAALRHARWFADPRRAIRTEDLPDLRRAVASALEASEITLAATATCRLLALGADAAPEVSAVRAAAPAGPSGVALTLALIEQQLEQGDPASVLDALGSLRPEPAQLGWALRLRAAAARRLGRLDLARQAIDEAQAAADSRPELQGAIALEQARIAASSGDPDAEGRLRKAAARFAVTGPPEREAEVLEALAELAAHRGQPAAEALFLRAIQLYGQASRPGPTAGALFGWARWLARAGRCDEARVAVEDGLQISGSPAMTNRGWRLLGDIAARDGDPGEAVLCYERTLKSAVGEGRWSDAVEARLRLAVQRLLDGELEAAAEAAHAGVAAAHVAGSDTPTALYGVLAVAHARGGNPAAGEAALAVLERMSGSGLALCLAAEAAAALGRSTARALRDRAADQLEGDLVAERLLERLDHLLGPP